MTNHSVVIETRDQGKVKTEISEIILRAVDENGNENEIKMLSTGEFFVNGELIETDKEVFANFKKFCARAAGN